MTHTTTENIQLEVQDMKVGMVDYTDNWEDEFGNEFGEKSDWTQVQKYGCFAHKDACEFIIFIGDTDDRIKEYNSYFSATFIDYLCAAQKKGFNYVCFYS